MARAIQLARVVVVEEPDTSAARKYLRRWGDEKMEGLVKASAVLAKATALSVHSSGNRAIRAKATFKRTVCLARDVSGTGLFVAEGQPRLDDDFQDEIDRCAVIEDETCVLSYDRNSETDDYSVTMKNGTICPDDRRDLHISLYSVLQLGLGDAQRRSLLSSALRVDITPSAVIGLAEQYQRTAAAVFVQGSIAFVNKWFEVEMPSDAAAESVAGASDDDSGADTSGCELDPEHVQSVAIGGSDGNDARFTIEYVQNSHTALHRIPFGTSPLIDPLLCTGTLQVLVLPLFCGAMIVTVNRRLTASTLPSETHGSCRRRLKTQVRWCSRYTGSTRTKAGGTMG